MKIKYVIIIETDLFFRHLICDSFNSYHVLNGNVCICFDNTSMHKVLRGTPLENRFSTGILKLFLHCIFIRWSQPYSSVKSIKRPLRVLLKISLCTEKGTSYRFFVTIFNPVFIISAINKIINGTK